MYVLQPHEPGVLQKKEDAQYNTDQYMLTMHYNRADEKTAADYQLEGGNTLHLVLALRGGL